MQKKFKLKKLYITGLVFFGIIFVILMNFNRAYISKTEILVIFKSEKSVQGSDQILKNLELISESLPFYEKVISDEEDAQNELISELPNYKRKVHWNKIVKMERIGGSSVLQVSATDQDAYTAEILSTQTVKSLLSIVGSYYDIKKDIDIRIINPAITQASFSGSYASLIFQSLIFGFILAFILNYFLSLLITENPKTKTTEKLPWSYKKESPLFSVDKDDPTEKKPEVKTEKAYFNLGKKAAAPANLPISDDSLFSAPVASKQEAKDSSEEEKPLIHEATPEEVKERLNKLLNGQL
jgi:hypothetical protein